MLEPGKAPRELNRLDQKNWTVTPPALAERLGKSLTALAKEVDAFILLSQVDQPETGVLTQQVLQSVAGIARANPKQVIVADSRHSLRGIPARGLQDERGGAAGADGHERCLRARGDSCGCR